MSFERILGFLLVLLGLGIIGFTLFMSFQIFTGKANPPQVFSFEEKKVAAPVKSASSPLGNFQELAQQTLQDQIQNIVPQGTVPILLNFTAWSFLAGLLLLGGSQIAGIGIKLIGAGRNNTQ